MKRRSALLTAGAVLVVGGGLAGCASVPVETTAHELRDLVRERSGERVEWRDVTADAGALEREVDELLGRPLDADAAAAIALLENRRLQAGFAELGRAAAERTRAGLPSNPLVEMVARWRDGDSGVPQLEISIVQEVVDLLLLPARRRVAAVGFERARLALVGDAVDLAADARIALLRYQAESQLLALDRLALEAAEAAWQMAERLHEAGNVRRLDLLAERELYETVKLETARRELAVSAARETVNARLGLWGDRTARWTAPPALPELPADDGAPADLERLAVGRSLALRAALLDVEAAARRRGITRLSAILPELELGAEGEREIEEAADGTTHREWWVGPAIAFRLPLFDGGRVARTAATLEIRQRWDLLAATAVEQRAAARRSAATLAHARSRARYTRDVLVPLRVAVTAETQLQFNAMSASVFQLLDAKRREIDAGRQAVSALRDYWLARAAVRRLEAGGAATSELGAPQVDESATPGEREEAHR